jgi:GNAT superfamily N-acetyltransferase
LYYKETIIELYLEAFAMGDSEQFIDMESLKIYLERILKQGIVLLAIENKKPIGALLACPLAFDNYVTSAISQNFEIDKCVYIAEMMVTENARGKGVGKELLLAFFQNKEAKLFSDAFIRVWDKNTGAIALYRKMGFEPFTTIEQTKLKANGSEEFVMRKIYLHKKID